MQTTLRLVALLILAFGTMSLSGCYYLQSEPVPEVSNYDLDLEGLRELAASLPGDRPTEIRRAHVGTLGLPGAMMMAGASWDQVEMTHIALQLVRADGTFLLVDTAQDREAHEASPGGGMFSDQAWDDVLRAAETAEQILISHEHPDHIGGAAKHPRPDALVGRLRLNEEQLANEEALSMAGFPETLRAKLVPLVYEDAIAVAPGVVVKRAAGHTPGNQIVFIQLTDGTEVLYVGDVVWNRDALTELRYRPRFITDWIINEDREAGLNQLRALRDLYDSDEDIHILIAHDIRTQIHPAIREGFVFPSS